MFFSQIHRLHNPRYTGNASVATEKFIFRYFFAFFCFYHFFWVGCQNGFLSTAYSMMITILDWNIPVGETIRAKVLRKSNQFQETERCPLVWVLNNGETTNVRYLTMQLFYFTALVNTAFHGGSQYFLVYQIRQRPNFLLIAGASWTHAAIIFITGSRRSWFDSKTFVIGSRKPECKQTHQCGCKLIWYWM